MVSFPLLFATHSSSNSLRRKSFSFRLAVPAVLSSRISSTVLLMVHCGHSLLPATCRPAASEPPPVRYKAPPQHPCGEASHSQRPTAASRCRWIQSTVAAASPRSPNGVGRGPRIAGWSVRHAAALRHLSMKHSRPTAPAATQRARDPNTATLSSFSFHSHFRSVSTISLGGAAPDCSTSSSFSRVQPAALCVYDCFGFPSLTSIPVPSPSGNSKTWLHLALYTDPYYPPASFHSAPGFSFSSSFSAQKNRRRVVFPLQEE
ncbi:hypothetical protein MOQ_007538 [Trypanosoma cruzi marinkellei]|uniref:Uncharacterized protein n=1 Tax=Trypanosoma cruzi marinkellei TaxID=85056 RepID=K2N2C6_TRYCR|nr:hypothetical protein MOQ_007538 [Trypanosoma cruzi marinkellei]